MFWHFSFCLCKFCSQIPSLLHEEKPGNMRENRDQLASLLSKLTRKKSWGTCLGTGCCSVPNQPAALTVSLEPKCSFKVENISLNKRNQVLPTMRSSSLKRKSLFSCVGFFFCPKSKELLPKWHEYQQKSRSTLESQTWTKWIVTETLNTPKLLSEELNHCRTLSESLNLGGSFYKHAKWGNIPCHPSS